MHTLIYNLVELEICEMSDLQNVASASKCAHKF